MNQRTFVLQVVAALLSAVALSQPSHAGLLGNSQGAAAVGGGLVNGPSALRGEAGLQGQATFPRPDASGIDKAREALNSRSNAVRSEAGERASTARDQVGAAKAGAIQGAGDAQNAVKQEGRSTVSGTSVSGAATGQTDADQRSASGGDAAAADTTLRGKNVSAGIDGSASASSVK